MSDDTTVAPSEAAVLAPNREKDAKLHQLLGYKAIYIAEQPMEIEYTPGKLPGVKSNFGGAVFTAQREWLVNDWLDPDTNDDVPHYSTDLAAAYEAEGALPPKLRQPYMRALWQIAGIPAMLAEQPVVIDVCWAMRRVTAAQMIDAMLAALSQE